MQALLDPDPQSRVEDVVLGFFGRLEDYGACPGFVGSIVGCVANGVTNRIANDRFELGGARYPSL